MRKLLAGAGMATMLVAAAGVASAQDEPSGGAVGDTGDAAAVLRSPGGVGRIADRLGLDRAELRAELEAGRTLAEIAAEQGLDIDTLIADAVAEAVEWAVEHPESRFAEEFDAERLTERLTAMANREVDPSERPYRHSGRRDGAPGGIGLGWADALGLDRAELRAELEAGRTLAEIAAEQGLDIDALIESLVDDLEERAAAAPDSRFAEELDRDEVTERLRGLADSELGHLEGPLRDGSGRPWRLPGSGRPGAAPPTGFEPVLPA